MFPPHIIKELNSIVGKEYVFLPPSNKIEEFSTDGTKLIFYPEVVVLPENEEQISEILKLANKEKVPIIPRGAGTGMSGGALAIKGGIVLGMNRMNRIIYIDPDNMVCKVEAGVITEDLQKEVNKYGLFYPPYPASANISTIGGNVAECAGGLRAVKYGVTRDYVMGLRMVLPTGEIVWTGTKAKKGVVGYDITRLIVGSEGTLAIITEILLRLIPAPEFKKGIILFFKDISSAIETAIKIIHSRIIPSILEFLDDICLDCVREDLYIPASSNSMLIIELDGPRSLVMEETERILKISENKALKAYSLEEEEEKKIWYVRNNLSHYMYRIKPNKISEDIVVPIKKIPDILDYIKSLIKEYGLPIPVFGHAGDGNLHVNIMFDKGKEEEVKKIREVISRILKKTVELEGTISGEHGIGITKSTYIGLEIPDHLLDLMKKIKKVFDPNNILNPGKIFCRSMLWQNP